jgi:hypothetical protein
MKGTLPMTIIRIILSTLAISILTACGGGGGTETPIVVQPTTATLKLSTSGTLASGTTLGGIGISVILPAGVTVKTDAGGAALSSVVTISGVATPGTYTAPVYTPAAGATLGKLTFVVVNNAPAGFGTGEFATVVCDIAAGSFPKAGDFSLTGFDPRSTGGEAVSGLTAGVGATIQ